MKRLLFALTMLISISAEAQVQRYERERVRQTLLDRIANPHVAPIEVKGEYPSEKHRAFVEFYLNRMVPKFREISDSIIRIRAYHVLKDSASYNDEAEKERFTQEYLKADAELNAVAVDQEWTATIEQWAQLSKGLTGDLPEMARRYLKDRQLSSFPEHLKDKLDLVSQLENEFDQARNEAPSNKRLEAFYTKLIESRIRFKNGEITFQEAQKISNELFAESGDHFVGFEAVQAKGENINRVAVLRSELAKEKGFKTWAELVLEENGQGYEEKLRGPKNQKKFLRQYIEAMAPLFKNYIDMRLRALGLEDSRDSLRMQHLRLLSPPGVQQLAAYFPNEQLTSMWENILRQNGFSDSLLSRIIVDDFVREGKMATGAYMSSQIIPQPVKDELDAATLNFARLPNGGTQWTQGLMYILQSYTSTGVQDLATAFHEGGHALDYLTQFKQGQNDVSYGSVEVPSMTMEYFTKDAEVLFNLAVPVNGKKPTIDEIRTLIENDRQGEIFNNLVQGAQALFDIELWDYDYSAPGAMKFIDRALQLRKDTWKLAGFPEDVISNAPLHYGSFSTSHFTSGSVRYIGYVYASLGSRMMSDFFTQELEKTTGQSSWYDQPGFAALFSDKFVSQSWKYKFPTNMEKITGQKFDPKAMAKKHKALQKSCAESLGK